MPYTVSFYDSGLLSQATRRRAAKLFREALENKLGSPDRVAELFAAYILVTACPIEEAAADDLQAYAQFALAYFEATAEALNRLADETEGRFKLRLT